MALGVTNDWRRCDHFNVFLWYFLFRGSRFLSWACEMSQKVMTIFIRETRSKQFPCYWYRLVWTLLFYQICIDSAVYNFQFFTKWNGSLSLEFLFTWNSGWHCSFNWSYTLKFKSSRFSLFSNSNWGLFKELSNFRLA